MNAENMWGEIEIPANQRTPTAILREQAAILSQLTRGTLVASLEQLPASNNTLAYNFVLTTPAIEHYRFTILTVQYSITIYPLTLTDRTTQVQRQCLNDADFIAALKGVLSSAQVKRVVSALVAQSHDARQA